MTTEEYLAEMHGRIDALTYACIALLATHPDGRAILITAKLGERAEPSLRSEKPAQRAFGRGIAEVAASLQRGLAFAASAQQIADPKPGSGH